MKRFALGLLYSFGRAIRGIVTGVAALASIGIFIAMADNYLATVPATGTSFASHIVSAVQYPIFLICDYTTGSAQCATVTSGGAVKTDASATTQPVSGTVTANAGTNLNTSALATSANQTNASQKSQIVDGSGNVIGSTSNALNVNVNNSTTAIKGSSPVVNGADTYITVAASQTGQVLQSSSGAAGDYLSFCVAYPTSTSPGVVTVFDSTSSAANNAIAFPGGSTSLSNLAPFAIPVGSVSVNGAWKVTTGANVIVTCVGKFS